ncbi:MULTISPECIES: site-specific integrase [Marinobacter]|uniref:Site-specific integrase n=1 Tax=Marinobacter xestospongiae TaxID=994319 RepID=A0ABU3VX82_9GAMM|nr:MULTISPECIES: site-specific integrase [Marinobacter]MCG8517357.1 phage integrase N-terminal SAM-like domain-containing protein [Pseudomonadales bacterium]MCK7568685.1 phage integrase N-terminal SAM-like domain-containing protein [Marinobacter xestospongiae]MDV2078883.1 site-specific integrase [Marinobacter xestospongiae]UDL04745.1 phage integrase N-terminal SAM-like domain-containing protein [Marinobacter sp. CA1]
MQLIEALEHAQPGLLSRVSLAIRQHQLNQRTEQNYLHWITRFVLFHDLKDIEALEADDRQQFLSYLGERIEVSRARLNQAKQALTFFYEDVLGKRDDATAAA